MRFNGFSPDPRVDPEATREQRGAVRVTLAILLLLGSLLVGGRTSAQPMLRIVAESRLELQVDPSEQATTLQGVLRDDAGSPLAGRWVRLHVVDSNDAIVLDTRLRTQSNGGFSTEASLRDGHHRFLARFEGDLHHAPQAQELAFAIGQAPLTLRLIGADRIDLSAPELTFTVEAQSDQGGAGVPVVLEDELQRTLAEGQTDAEGRLTITQPARAFGPPGPGSLVARSPGDATRTAASVERSVLRELPLVLTIDGMLERDHRILLVGQLRPASGAGEIGARSVGIFDAEDRHLTTLRTSEGGNFQFRAVPPEEGELARYYARYDSDAIGLPTVRSETFEITLERPGQPWWQLAIPVLLALLWLAKRRGEGESDEPLERTAEVPEVQLGVQRIAKSSEISGRLIDRHGRGIAGAWSVQGQDLAGETDASGEFRFECPAGTFTLEFSAPGRANHTLAVDAPHRGRYAHMRIRLDTWRERALAALRDAVRTAMPRLPWRKTTIHALGQHPQAPQDLQALSREVETMFYGPAEPRPEQVSTVEAKSQAISGKSEAESPR